MVSLDGWVADRYGDWANRSSRVRGWVSWLWVTRSVESAQHELGHEGFIKGGYTTVLWEMFLH